ncbi:cytochrome P450 [Streptomyces sp. NPDC020681]|uniref:cytochrome P450 n=1 Tax=Streptomyces sp. NPDC020681 TaxID=3365083 RepID=UPI0037B345D7
MVTQVEFDPAAFSLSNPDLIADPYPAYALMRSADPIHRSAMYGGSWVLFAYEDVAALLCDPRLTNNRATLPLKALPAGQRAEFADIVPVLDNWVAFFDGSRHWMRRRHMNQVCDLFTKDVLTRVIQESIDMLLDRWNGRHDVIADFARPLPAIVITRLLGSPWEDHEKLAAWSDRIAYLFGASALTVDDLRAGQAALHAFASYLREQAHEAMCTGATTMVTRMTSETTREFSFTVEEACAQAMLLMFAGVEPTRYLIGNAVHALDASPRQRRLVTFSERTRAIAVEEFLRHGTPVQYIGRMAAEDFTYKGHRIEAGQPVLLYVGSANRDAAQFPDPEVLDLTRRPNLHLALGKGPHNCIGAFLVRVQTAMALHSLLTRFPDLRVVKETAPISNTNLGFHGFNSLTVDTSAQRPDDQVGLDAAL